jgi:hypothetical protein
MRAGRLLASALMLAAVAGGLTTFGCSLGLDASLINQDAGESDSAGMGEGGGGDSPSDVGGDKGTNPSDSGGTDGGEAGPPAGGGACQKDSDCVAAAGDGGVGDAGGCVASAKCDKTWHVCLLDVCPTSTCSAASCVTSSNTCTIPSSYGFAPGSFKVTYGGVGSWGPQASIAAVWPFVFVVTTNGVIAYNVSDPTASTPPQVPVHGVPFLPGQAIAVGRRVYLVTAQQGPGPTYHEAVAWIDVPQNPLLTSLEASSAWLSDANKSLNAIITNGVDGLYFVYTNTPLWPSANLHPPLTDSTSITTYPSMNFPMNAAVRGSSGTRLWTSRYDGSKNAFWGSLVTAAGTSSALTLGEVQVGAGLGLLDGQVYFGQGADGSVLMSVAPLTEVDGGPNGVNSACVAWMLDSSSAANFDAAKCPPLETYSPPVNGVTVVGPPGWIDAKTALGLAGASSNPGSSTSVHVVKNSPPSVEQGKVAYLPVGTGATGVATSNGFGYVLTQDDSMNQTCTVYVFAPGCSAGGD